MELHFCDPGLDYSLDIITEFQQSDLSDWWKDSLFHFYPQIDRAEYETPSLKWIFSEMAVEPIMRDERLSTINPYFEDGCVYEYFYHMDIGGKPVLEILYEMYRQNDIKEFMKKGFLFCQEHEAEIRRQMK